MFILWYIFHNFNELTGRYPPQLHRQRALIRPKKEKNRVSKSRLMCSFYLNFFFQIYCSHILRMKSYVFYMLNFCQKKIVFHKKLLIQILQIFIIFRNTLNQHKCFGSQSQLVFALSSDRLGNPNINSRSVPRKQYKPSAITLFRKMNSSLFMKILSNIILCCRRTRTGCYINHSLSR